MTKEFANHKLNIVFDALVKVYQKMGNTKEQIDKVFSLDKELNALMKESDAMPMTKHNYGFYLSQMRGGNATVMACVMFKSGGNPIGILSALCIQTGIDLNEMEKQSYEFTMGLN